LLLSSPLKPAATTGRRQTLAGPYLFGMLFVPQTKNIVLKSDIHPLLGSSPLYLHQSFDLVSFFPTNFSCTGQTDLDIFALLLGVSDICRNDSHSNSRSAFGQFHDGVL
jgi:hypothetical protein